MDSEIGLTLYSKTSFICLPSSSKYKSAFSGHMAARKHTGSPLTANAKQRTYFHNRWAAKAPSLCTRNIPGTVFFKWDCRGREKKSEGDRNVHSQGLRFRLCLIRDLRLQCFWLPDSSLRKVGLMEDDCKKGERPLTVTFNLKQNSWPNTACSLAPRAPAYIPHLGQPLILDIWKREGQERGSD